MIFRYPGGKTRMLPILSEFLSPILKQSEEYHDVFVGGGSVLIDVAKNHRDMKLHANDLNKNIYSFWKIISDGKNVDQLVYLIEKQPTIELFNHLRCFAPVEDYEMAYYAIFFNRTTFSGIETAGAIGGQSQSSKWKVDCRYNSKSIISNIESLLKLMSGRLTVHSLPANEYLEEWCDGCLYLDPPYYKKGKELYSVYMLENEHKLLAKKLIPKRNWVLSYDDCPEIRKLYSWGKIVEHGSRYSISGVKKKWANKNELIIINDNP